MASERVIVCGAGGISGAWFKPLKDEGVQVVAVVDIKRENAEKRIAEFGFSDAKAYDDLDKALAECAGKADFFIDITVPDAHCAVTCKALEAGLHVIGEKPMAASMAEARKMVATAEKTGKMYAVGQSRRYELPQATLAQAAKSGEIGDLTTLNCDFYIGAHFGGFRDEMASPLILDMSIHHFDMARMFSGQNAISVYAEEFNPKGSWYKGDVSANCLFEMTGGIHFAYRGSWCSEGCHTNWNGDWRVIGTKGTLLMAGDNMPSGEVVDGKEGFHRPKRPAVVPAASLPGTTHHGELLDFLRFLRTGEKPQTECHDNIQSLAMVFAAIASARAGRRVKISEL